MVSEKELEEGAKLAKQDHSNGIGQPVGGLTTDEKGSLAVQRYSAFWREPSDLLTTLVVCCLASITQGWDQVANGNVGWPVNFGSSADRCEPRKKEGTFEFAIAQAAPWFSASILGSFLSNALSEYTGRRMALFTAALCSFTSSIWGSQVTSWEALIGSRILLGIGIGGKAAIVSVLQSEVLPSAKRDYLLVNWQVFNAVGTILGSIVCYILRNIWNSNSWRLQILSGVIPGFALLMATLVSCESPRGLVIQGKHRRAFKRLLRLHQERHLALKELLSIHYRIQVERALSLQHDTSCQLDPRIDPFDTNMSWWNRFRSTLYVPGIRRAAIGSMIVMISQPLSGYVYHVSIIYTKYFPRASIIDQE